MPTDEWLCKKMGKLNLTLTEGYPSRSSEASGLLKDQFVRAARSQAKWYGFVFNQQKIETETGKTVSPWSTDASASNVNSTYSRIAMAARHCLNSTSLTSDFTEQSENAGKVGT